MSTSDSRVHLKTIRPLISIEPVPEEQAHLRFQNETLRPILKLQHELIVALATGTLGFDQLQHHSKSKEEFINLIVHFIGRQAELRHQLIGMVIGQFTIEEWQHYSLHTAEYKKRIIHLSATRIASIY